MIDRTIPFVRIMGLVTALPLRPGIAVGAPGEMVSTDGTDTTFYFTDFSINTSPSSSVVPRVSSMPSWGLADGSYTLTGQRVAGPEAWAGRGLVLSQQSDERGRRRSEVVFSP